MRPSFVAAPYYHACNAFRGKARILLGNVTETVGNGDRRAFASSGTFFGLAGKQAPFGTADKAFQNNSSFIRTLTSDGKRTIIDEIRRDHKDLERFYRKYKKAVNKEEGREWFNMFVWDLSRHAMGEEMVFYPLMASVNEEGKKYVEEARGDHSKVKKWLSDLQSEKDPVLFDQKFDDLMRNLRKHINDEEVKHIRFLLRNVPEHELEKAGRKFEARKKLAPTRPHTAIPDRPVFLGVALSILTAPVDKFRDLFRRFPSEAL